MTAFPQWIPLVYIGFHVLMLVIMIMCKILECLSRGDDLSSVDITYQLDVSPAQAETQMPSVRIEPVATHSHFPSAPPVKVAEWSNPTAPPAPVPEWSYPTATPPSYAHPPAYTQAIFENQYCYHN